MQFRYILLCCVHTVLVVSCMLFNTAHAEIDTKKAIDTLVDAAFRGDLKTVHHLLEEGACVNGVNADGWTSLHTASQKGHLDIVHYLVKKGAFVDAAYKNGGTALHSASLFGHLDIVRCLVKQGACIDATNDNGRTPLFVASEKDYLNIVRYLMKKGALVDAATQEGFTPLHLAASMESACYKTLSPVEESDEGDKAHQDEFITAFQTSNLAIVHHF